MVNADSYKLSLSLQDTSIDTRQLLGGKERRGRGGEGGGERRRGEMKQEEGKES